MSDIPVEKKETLLTVEERLDIMQNDIRELARGINVQGSLLQAMVYAFDSVVKRYVELTTTPAERGVAVAEKPSVESK
jgi:hypothetical protein